MNTKPDAPSAPDVDTADLEEAAEKVSSKVKDEKPKSKKAPAKMTGPFMLLSILALVLSAGLVYFFFFWSNQVSVVLHSDPPGATMILDGKNLGVSPVKTKTSPGTHTLIIRQPGFQTFEQEINVQFDGTVIEQKLVPLNNPKAPAQ